ncbi:HD domain-containing protein [Micromonospora noduli]|uniref:GTP diphosphokinase n=1 Tax=Micromonospora noduli TaxID=709876 RepID=A0A328N8C9_9ACTN|nr:HD domain-containing protein [Micromonospora noduli]KAB1921338.1 bifunctional (p)ppGpp synthetase/guanosine-3',5'-bis(diphosphate) 3'-pyrophosphohydrolase [Micromonospora noduli]RAO05221.1 GTP diphosphokinase [Micromonospora noduli]RAO07506.1 GTP diphosphokinase [Micromonospora noduli]RAO20371.1 GTP diphosphokinase [Micromonospora noduli]RAO21697.1 GTP diphosphokinase [Micromonospora noduli]
MDVDAGHGAALGGALPTQPGELPLARRLRSLLSWPTTDSDPVTQLVRTHRGIHAGTDPAVLRRAYTIAENMHRGQFRKSGEPYITHPLAVAQICAELGMDTTTLVAALLHDTVEDTRYTLQALSEDFGGEVAHLVDGVTKFDKAFYGKAAEAETVRKMIVAAAKDVRVLIIKLADRLHNMRTLGVRSASSRERIARKTQEVLVPLCDRLGIQTLKRELDDVVLLHLEPDEHARLARHVHDRPGWDSYLDSVVTRARVALRRSRVDAEVSPRPRHLYSIWKDTIAGGHTAPYDLPRIVVVVDGPATDCYAALGAIHGTWRPVPGRFKDFIASPKNNLYRSLHTSVCGPQDRTVEVLIRTEEMHRSAEYGIAADFRFPRSGSSTAAARAEQLDWLRRVLDWEPDAADPAQFYESLRCDLAEGQIQVFADGRQVVLPAGATPVDLAYELGNDRGDHCLAARINGRLAPLSSELDEGDVVEIFTENDGDNGFEAGVAPRGPRREWLTFVKSPHAQMQINRWFAEHTEPGITISDKVRLGRATIGLALRQHNRGLASDLPLLRLSEELGYPDLETLLVAVFDRVIEPDTVVRQLIDLVDHRQ